MRMIQEEADFTYSLRNSSFCSNRHNQTLLFLSLSSRVLATSFLALLVLSVREWEEGVHERR